VETRIITLDHSNTFERMEVNKGRFGA
jgi:hypothetical protein